MLRDDINAAVKDAMKAKDERKLSTLRMVNSTIKNADIEARGQGKPPLGDGDILGVLQKMIKQRQESVELYDKGGRAELAAQEERFQRAAVCARRRRVRRRDQRRHLPRRHPRGLGLDAERLAPLLDRRAVRHRAGGRPRQQLQSPRPAPEYPA